MTKISWPLRPLRNSSPCGGLAPFAHRYSRFAQTFCSQNDSPKHKHASFLKKVIFFSVLFGLLVSFGKFGYVLFRRKRLRVAIQWNTYEQAFNPGLCWTKGYFLVINSWHSCSSIHIHGCYQDRVISQHFLVVPIINFPTEQLTAQFLNVLRNFSIFFENHLLNH